MPVEKHAGDRVTGATLNGSGSLVIRADKVGADTLLARIVQMVADAQRSRAPIQRLADKVAGWFVPAVIAAAIVTFIVWALVGPEPQARPRGHQRGRGADHRLPVRARPRHAHVDHGRHRARRPCGRAVPRRRIPRDPGEGGYAGGGQDRHADRGQAALRRSRGGRGLRARRGAQARRRAGSGQRASAGRRHRRRRRDGRARRGQGGRLRRRHRQGRHRHGRGAQAWRSATAP